MLSNQHTVFVLQRTTIIYCSCCLQQKMDFSKCNILDDLNDLLDTALENMQNRLGILQRENTNRNCEYVIREGSVEQSAVVERSNSTVRECFVKLLRLPDQSNKIHNTATRKNHFGSTSSEKHVQCKICTYRAVNKRSIVRHIKLHTKVKSLARNIICNYRTAQQLQIHVGEKPFSCNVCERSFIQKSSLVSHMKIHTGEKPFSCNVCERSFIQKSSLVSHIKIHTGEKPFSCNVCERSFIQKTHLACHMKIHTGEKPFSCNICERSFIQKNNLVRHMKVHTGEKPFSCNVCGHSFIHKQNLARHMKIHPVGKSVTCT